MNTAAQTLINIFQYGLNCTFSRKVFNLTQSDYVFKYFDITAKPKNLLSVHLSFLCVANS